MTGPDSSTSSGSHFERSAVQRFGIAALLVAASALLRWWLTPWLGEGVPFILFFPAVMASAWLGGLSAGFLATFLASLVAWYLFIPPQLSLTVKSTSGWIQLGFFTGLSILISWMSEALHRARRQAEGDARKLREQEKERSELLAATEQALRQAEAASRSKDELLANVSHELRTPLNSMMGWAQLLLASRDDPERLDRGLRSIARNAKQQSQLIDDLLDVSRIVSGKMRLDVRPVHPARVIEAALEAIRPAAEAKQIRLLSMLDPQAGPVPGDADRLQQVVWNLLSNAVKFTPKEGRVEVRLERVNSHVEILVADTGAGIGPDLLPYVFDRFRQRDSSTTRAHGGLGLGLAIARHLVELHGGTVEARSPGEGQGSTFIVRLPLAIAHLDAADAGPRVHPRAEPEPPRDEPLPDLQGIRVLVVDDDPEARSTVTEILRQCGAEALAVGSAAEAVAAVEGFRPDVLLSDIGMPERDGYSLIEELRRLPPERGGDVPAAALTAFARSEDRRRALLAGYQNHLAKPVEVGELAAVVASLARRHSASR